MDKEESKARLQSRLDQIHMLQEQLRMQWRDRLATLVTTALGVVAALFWQTAITDTIKAFIPVSGAWPYEIAVAMLVTGLAVMALFLMSALGPKQTTVAKPEEKKPAEKEEKKDEKK